MGGCLHRVGEAAGDVRLDHKAVHYDLDGMFDVFVQLDLLAEIINTAIHPYTDKAALAGILKNLLIFALSTADDGRQHLHTGTFGQRHQLVNDLIHALLTDLFSALGTMGNTDPRPQKAQIIVNFGNSTHSRAGVFACGFLVDGNGRRKAVNRVHVGLFHLPQKHPGIAGQGFHIAALTFGINGIEGQTALAAARDTGDHRHGIPRNLHVDIFQIVDASALDHNGILHDITSFVCKTGRRGRRPLRCYFFFVFCSSSCLRRSRI